MMRQKDSPLRVKSAAFSDRIIQLYNYLLTVKHEQIMSTQIYRSGTSIGANISESRFAQSEADFISKLSIALKEAGETEYWLERLHKCGHITQKGFESLMEDNTEIIKMLVSSINTMKKKTGKR